MIFDKEVAKSYLKYCHPWLGDNDELFEGLTYNGYDGWFIEDGLNRLDIKYDSIEDKMVVDEHWVKETDHSNRETGENNKYVFSILKNDTGKILMVDYHYEEYYHEIDEYGGGDDCRWPKKDVKQYIVPDDFVILNGLDGIELKKLEESAKAAKR